MKDKEQSRARIMLNDFLNNNEAQDAEITGDGCYLSEPDVIILMERYHAEKQRTDDRELLIRFMAMREGHAVNTTDINLIDEFLDGQIHAKEKQVKGAPFDDPANFNPACEKCGHQNSENYNTCII